MRYLPSGPQYSRIEHASWCRGLALALTKDADDLARAQQPAALRVVQRPEAERRPQSCADRRTYANTTRPVGLESGRRSHANSDEPAGISGQGSRVGYQRRRLSRQIIE